MPNVRFRAEKVRIPYIPCPHKFFLYFQCIHRHLWCFIPSSFYAFVRTLLFLVLIRILGMLPGYVLFHNSCSSNLCPFENQTCCQSMKNLKKKQLGLSFEDFFFYKIPGLWQLEQWLWENKEMAIISKWQMLFQSRCQSKSPFQSYTFLYYCPLLRINTIW